MLWPPTSTNKLQFLFHRRSARKKRKGHWQNLEEIGEKTSEHTTHAIKKKCPNVGCYVCFCVCTSFFFSRFSRCKFSHGLILKSVEVFPRHSTKLNQNWIILRHVSESLEFDFSKDPFFSLLQFILWKHAEDLLPFSTWSLPCHEDASLRGSFFFLLFETLYYIARQKCDENRSWTGYLSWL
jgi:hypothetical protein